jgi:hypothetical protein
VKTGFFWGGVAISIAVASWIFYRYVAPKSWRELTRAVLRERRRGEKSDCLGEGARNRHATDTRRSIGQSGRRRRSPCRVTETIEEPKLRK